MLFVNPKATNKLERRAASRRERVEKSNQTRLETSARASREKREKPHQEAIAVMALALVSGCSVALADIRSSSCPAVLLHSHCEFSSCCPVQVSANKNRTTTTAAAILAARSLGCLGTSEIARDCCICSCRDEELTLSKPRTQAPMSALTQSGSVCVMTTKKKKKIQDAIIPVPHSGKCWSSKSAVEKIRGAKSVRVRAEAEHLSEAMVDREEEDKNNKNKEECTREEMEEFVEVANKLADAAGTIIRKYFRTRFDIIDKADTSRCSPSSMLLNLPVARERICLEIACSIITSCCAMVEKMKKKKMMIDMSVKGMFFQACCCWW